MCATSSAGAPPRTSDGQGNAGTRLEYHRLPFAAAQNTMKRDKQKVVDEVWDDAQVASFLHKVAPDLPGDPDFHVLLFAYQSMRPGDFGRFLDCYVDAGRDVTARNGDGATMAHYLSRHANAGPYIDLLESAAARSRR